MSSDLDVEAINRNMCLIVGPCMELIAFGFALLMTKGVVGVMHSREMESFPTRPTPPSSTSFTPTSPTKTGEYYVTPFEGDGKTISCTPPAQWRLQGLLSPGW